MTAEISLRLARYAWCRDKLNARSRRPLWNDLASIDTYLLLDFVVEVEDYDHVRELLEDL